MVRLYVREYIQVAHRLTKLPGKCQQIHGHSMDVYCYLHTGTNLDGYAIDADGNVLDFGEVKKVFRKFLNDGMDHHLMLYGDDPLKELDLPGATYWPEDPAVENIAKWVYEYMQARGYPVAYVEVKETASNGVCYP